MPRQKNSPASVTIKGCILKMDMKQPCTKPTAIPIKRTKNKATGMASSVFCNSQARLMQTRATTEPTEISIPPPPVMIVKVTPTVMIIKVALSMSKFQKTCGREKPLYMATPMPYRMMNSMTVTKNWKYREAIAEFIICFIFMLYPPPLLFVSLL